MPDGEKHDVAFAGGEAADQTVVAQQQGARRGERGAQPRGAGVGDLGPGGAGVVVAAGGDGVRLGGVQPVAAGFEVLRGGLQGVGAVAVPQRLGGGGGGPGQLVVDDV